MKAPLIKLSRYFPILVGVLSLINSFMLLAGQLNLLSLVVSLVGMAACLLSFTRKYDKLNKNLLGFWVWAQLIIIRSPDSAVIKDNPITGKHYVYTKAVFDGSQVFSYSLFNLNRSYKEGEIRGKIDYFKINGLVILYVFILRLYRISRVEGSRIKLYKLRRDVSVLDDLMPTDATVLRQVKIMDDNAWLLVETDNTLQYEGREVRRFIIQRKDKDPIQPGSGNQVIHFRAVLEPQLLEKTDSSDLLYYFPELDWAVCT